MNGKKKSSVFVLILACGALLLAAEGLLRAQEFSFRTLGSAEGLDNLEVRKIFQDRVGFLWVSTENGIYRYDGERFEIFGPAQGMPLANGVALGEAPDGSLLAGGDFGLFRLRNNHFERVSGPFKKVEWRQGIQADGRGHSFVATDDGLIELSSVAAHVLHVVGVRDYSRVNLIEWLCRYAEPSTY